ncbi:secreted alkaline phosphatase [Actinosynnema pretiosum subsp. pretiosum]|nr:secreted alkaline phosphatase [Actinosynnema pretiosum subsp. pretiosum]
MLAARAFRAFHEWQPVDPARAVDGRVYRKFPCGAHVEVFVLDMRSYKDANTSPRDKTGHVPGTAQARWLVDALDRGTATWKIIAADLPLGLAGPGGGLRLRPVLGVRVRAAARGRVRAERPGPHLRPAGGLRERPTHRQHLAAGRGPALRRGVRGPQHR